MSVSGVHYDTNFVIPTELATRDLEISHFARDDGEVGSR